MKKEISEVLTNRDLQKLRAIGMYPTYSDENLAKLLGVCASTLKTDKWRLRKILELNGFIKKHTKSRDYSKLYKFAKSKEVQGSSHYETIEVPIWMISKLVNVGTISYGVPDTLSHAKLMLTSINNDMKEVMEYLKPYIKKNERRP